MTMAPSNRAGVTMEFIFVNCLWIEIPGKLFRRITTGLVCRFMAKAVAAGHISGYDDGKRGLLREISAGSGGAYMLRLFLDKAGSPGLTTVRHAWGREYVNAEGC